ncbi:potassium-transporting ATPase subunit KdpA [Asticcacaulis benevestitus]|uniref:Uncharacterized protein n=1 Tax=Asticcacaulis benevestitus DSM 16100 = ATCC BAA-896 TaxID=1121022 RepID=V4PFT3_9CAUL|nr:potassium-transporting ATPase subunit KdpA [Asticcacaulis benevestitus]ESQ92842.1 hypothetical protein ABENE_06995 [Asticcacaulis benevestitus DSM 16100 = ATCC BAA-896]
MVPNSPQYLHFVINLAVLALCIAPMGGYLSRVYRGKPTFLSPLLSWLEAQLYWAAGVDAEKGMSWKSYALSVLVFSGFSFVVLYSVLMLQDLQGVSPALAFKVAAGFITNSGVSMPAPGSALTPASRMLGLTVQNFLSAAVSISVFVAVTRGITRTASGNIGNFWVDLVRSVLYVLLPLSLAYALLIATAGVGDAIEAYAVSNLGHPSTASNGLEAVAATETLKLTVTQAGSFVNANSAHLAAVSTPLTSLIDFLSRWLIPAALCWTFGNMIRDKRQAYLLLGGVVALFGVSALTSTEFAQNPVGTLGGLADRNGTVLYLLVALMTLTACIRRWVLGRGLVYKDHKVGRFDLTMALTALLVPAIALGAFHLLSLSLPAFASPLSALDALWGGAILLSRFWIMIPALAIAGSFATTPRSSDGQTKWS